MAARSRSRGWCPPLCLLAFLSTLAISLAADTLGQGESIRDGQTLVSAGGVFELGFFSPRGSSNRYVGIWYKNIAVETVVWVGNRNDPFADASGELILDSLGSLMIRGRVHEVVLMKGTGGRSSSNAALNDSGQVLWQSFDYPTDTWLPGMTLGPTGEFDRRLTSWRSPTDPSLGDYSFQDERTQLVVMQKTTQIWNSRVLALGGHTVNPWDSCDAIRNLRYTGDSNGSQESYFVYDASPNTRFVMDVEGQIRLWTWTFPKWTMLWAMPEEGRYKCVSPSSCGSNGLCNATATPTCKCLPGFDPYSNSKWNSGDWSDGCIIRSDFATACPGDAFFPLQVEQLPVLGFAYNSSLDCTRLCLAKCSCTAYAGDYGKIAGCFLWFGQLMGLQENRTSANELYIRLAASEPPPPPAPSTDTSVGGHGSTVTNEKPRQQMPGGSPDLPSTKPVDVPDSGIKLLLLIVLPIVSVAILLFGVALCCFLGVKCGGHREESGEELFLRDIGRDGAVTYRFVDTNEGAGERGPEIHVYSFSNVLAATNNFSDDNKLGQGGFGPVYKGKLPGGQEIAIKRLSTRSGQGLEEFKTEILLIARLQHKNLVRLLGCCIQGEERLLIYEYMPNKSLDFFLFDPKRAAQLDWDRRNQIIEGIAQGLLYLHKYSRLTVIHRDLKASNILLDNEMNPKISDFGMARIFNSNEDQASTNRIVGTYGYMSPEYAMEGVFSVKSDVFSFGVLLLEIVSGKKNIGSHRCFPIPRSLLGYAWELWNAGRELELMDPLLGGSCPGKEVSRCIYVGLSCVQECANDRPTMTEVVAMLSSENPARQAPKQPAFLTGRSSSSDSAAAKSTSDMTISALEGR